MIRTGAILLTLIAVVGFVGCGPTGPATAPVKGTVTIGGKPADGIGITFAPVGASGTPAIGQVKNGSYELFSGSEGKPGAVPGKYKVVLAPPAGGEEMYKNLKPGEKPAPVKAPFPDKYRSATTSDKEVEVKSGSNTIPIEIPAE